MKTAANLEAGAKHIVAHAHGAANGARRTVERRKHAVAGDVDHLTAMTHQGLAHHVLEAIAHATPTAVSELARVFGRSDDVDHEHGCEKSIRFVDLGPRAGHELLDRAEQLRFGTRPVICATAYAGRPSGVATGCREGPVRARSPRRAT